MRSFLIWLFRDIFWENILWIGLGAAVLFALFMLVGFFVSDETLERWENEDRNAGSPGEAGGEDAGSEEGSWAEEAAGLAPSLRSLASDDTGEDDLDVVGWLTED